MRVLALTLFPGFASSLILGRLLIPKLKKMKIGQHIRAEGPKTHRKKSGTPTIGGLIFIFAIVFSRALTLVLSKVYPGKDETLILALMLFYGLIGFIDDYRQIRLGRSLGLRAREKMALQVLFAALFLWFFVDRGSKVIIPFSGRVFDLGVFYPILGIVLIVGTGNGMNLTDGLDGMATGVAAIGLGAYALIAKAYSVATNQPDLLGLTALAITSIGALLGFLMFNRNPAKVFMGDTGSLALGGLLAGYAIATQTELVFILIGAVQLIEVISVMLQVFSFQVFGRRIFKMTPLHHHFELLGWSERRVVHLFWFVSFIMAILGVASMAYV